MSKEKKLTTAACEWCKRSFQLPVSSWQRTCSKKCRNLLTAKEEREQPSAIQIEETMQSILANEVAMPWEKKPRPAFCFMTGKRR